MLSPRSSIVILIGQSYYFTTKQIPNEINGLTVKLIKQKYSNWKQVCIWNVKNSWNSLNNSNNMNNIHCIEFLNRCWSVAIVRPSSSIVMIFGQSYYFTTKQFSDEIRVLATPGQVYTVSPILQYRFQQHKLLYRVFDVNM